MTDDPLFTNLSLSLPVGYLTPAAGTIRHSLVSARVTSPPKSESTCFQQDGCNKGHTHTQICLCESAWLASGLLFWTKGGHGSVSAAFPWFCSESDSLLLDLLQDGVHLETWDPRLHCLNPSCRRFGGGQITPLLPSLPS